MKRVVSLSLGTSKRDKRSEFEWLGEGFVVERIGTDGDLKRYRKLFHELDGKVDAIGVGGADIYVVVDDRRYPWGQIARIAASVKRTPVVDGSGLKHTLERDAVDWLIHQALLVPARDRVLLVAGVERFGMAQALEKHCVPVTYGDLMFGLGLPIPLRSYRQVRRLARVLLPILTRLPQTWVYPVGSAQEKRSPKFPAVFAEADWIAGDWHFIRRYAPDDLRGKSIFTQTVRKGDIEWLRNAGATRLVTTTPLIGGETFATNVMEACLVALIGRNPEEITPDDYRTWLAKLQWEPGVIALTPP